MTPTPTVFVFKRDEHRCDKCGAEAKAHALMPSGYELLFCRHHSDEFSPRLALQGAAFTHKEQV